MWASFLTTHWFASCPVTTTYLCWPCHSPLPDKENCFVCLFTVSFLSTTVWVFSLTILHGMHLVVLTHPSLFWVVCHPRRTFPPKEFEWEPQNRLSLLTTARLYLLLPLTHDPPLLYWLGIGWWCLGFVCAPLLCMSKACLLLMHFHDLETHMCILSLILDLLWRELFSNPPFFMVCFLQGLSLAWLWDFLSFSLLFAPSVGLLVFLPCHPVIPVVVLFDPCLLGLFGARYMFFSQLVKMT